MKDTARYIDADKLCKGLKEMASVQPPDKQNTILGVVSTIENTPAADVVPNAGVEMLKKIILTNVEATEFEVKEAKARLAREIFEEINKIICRYLNDSEYSVGEMMYDIDVLSKKYVVKNRTDIPPHS